MSANSSTPPVSVSVIQNSDTGNVRSISTHGNTTKRANDSQPVKQLQSQNISSNPESGSNSSTPGRKKIYLRVDNLIEDESKNQTQLPPNNNSESGSNSSAPERKKIYLRVDNLAEDKLAELSPQIATFTIGVIEAVKQLKQQPAKL